MQDTCWISGRDNAPRQGRSYRHPWHKRPDTDCERYYRTALGEFSFALVILKLFERSFVKVGALYTTFALLLLCLGWLRSELGRRDFERTDDSTFVTCGSVVLLTSMAHCERESTTDCLRVSTPWYRVVHRRLMRVTVSAQ